MFKRLSLIGSRPDAFINSPTTLSSISCQGIEDNVADLVIYGFISRPSHSVFHKKSVFTKPKGGALAAGNSESSSLASPTATTMNRNGGNVRRAWISSTYAGLSTYDSMSSARYPSHVIFLHCIPVHDIKLVVLPPGTDDR